MPETESQDFGKSFRYTTFKQQKEKYRLLFRAFLRNVSTTQPFDERLKNSMPLVERFIRGKMDDFVPEADAGDGLSPELRRALNEDYGPNNYVS